VGGRVRLRIGLAVAAAAVAATGVVAVATITATGSPPRTAGGVGPELTSLPPATIARPVTTTVPPTTLPPVPVGVPDEPDPEPAPPAAGVPDGFDGRGIVVVAAGGADVATSPNGTTIVRAREGIVLPALGRRRGWIRILTTCDEEAWVRTTEVAAVETADPGVIGPGFDIADAVVVVDPGHGGPNIGTASPDGSMAEKDVNVDISRRLRDLLTSSHTVDWESGTIFTGAEVPAVANVVLTRVGAGADADYEAGLTFRATLANALGAHAMVSIHNNAGWEIDLDVPGSDVYYQSQVAESRRFAELLVEEFRRSFGGFEADWVGAIETGAKSRLSPRDGSSQYYGILRQAEMPTVIAEGAYLSNASEAALLATAAFRQAYAEAVYRALVRFLSTDHVAAALSYDPVVWAGGAGSGDPQPDCTLPAQP
jgi:N-acetylmuramoyl-L-alanine amidase